MSSFGLRDVWDLVQLFCVVSLIAILLRLVTADHSPRFYYLKYSDSQGTCVMSYREWADDHTVFCSQDVNKTLDVMGRMNASLPKK